MTEAQNSSTFGMIVIRFHTEEKAIPKNNTTSNVQLELMLLQKNDWCIFENLCYHQDNNYLY